MDFLYDESQLDFIRDKKRFRLKGWKAIQFFVFGNGFLVVAIALLLFDLFNKGVIYEETVVISTVFFAASLLTFLFSRYRLRFTSIPVSFSPEEFENAAMRANTELGWKIVHLSENAFVGSFWGEVMTVVRSKTELLVNCHGGFKRSNIKSFAMLVQSQTKRQPIPGEKDRAFSKFGESQAERQPIPEEKEWTFSKTIGRITLYIASLILIALSVFMLFNGNFFIPLVILGLTSTYLFLDLGIVLSKRKKAKRDKTNSF